MAPLYLVNLWSRLRITASGRASAGFIEEVQDKLLKHVAESNPVKNYASYQKHNPRQLSKTKLRRLGE